MVVLFNLPLFFTLQITKSVVNTSQNVTKRFHISSLSSFGHSNYYYVFTWIRFIYIQCLPLIVLCLVNSMLLRLIWSSYRHQKAHETNNKKQVKTNIFSKYWIKLFQTNDLKNSKTKIYIRRSADRRLEKSQQANNKLTVLLVSIIFLFIIGQIPQAFAYAHILNAILPLICTNCQIFSNLYRHFSQMLCLITSTVNFFLYLGLNKHFRQCLKHICPVKCFETHRITISPISNNCS